MQLNQSTKLTAAALLTTVVLTGCNTMKGLGEDVQRGGEKVTQSAEQTQQKM